jgi:type VI secretion system protein ImpF
MAELVNQARLQPALLDRLTDPEPGTTQESRDRRVISFSQLKAAVLRDLAWLLNTAAPLPDEFKGMPEIEKSVLNYGVGSLTGKTASTLRVIEVERMLARAIERFEPRILPRTLKVRVVPEERTGRPNTLVLTIEGDLWGDPLPEALYIRTQVDLETGHVTVEEGGR